MQFYHDIFRKIRLEKKCKLSDICKKLEVNRNTLWLWEKGKVVPKEKSVKLLAKAIGVDVDIISDIPKEMPSSTSIDAEKTNKILTKFGETDLHELENIQSYFLGEIKKQFQQLNPLVCLVSTFLNSLPIICYSKDLKNRFIIVNKAFLENVSMPKDFRVAGSTDYRFFSNIEARDNQAEDEKVIFTGESILYSEKYIPGSKKKKWGLVSKIPVHDSNNHIIGMIGFFIDITQRKIAEEKNLNFIRTMNMLDEVIWIAKKAENKPEGGILFSDFIYLIKSSLAEKVFGQIETGLSDEELYMLTRDMITYHDKEATVEKLNHEKKLISHQKIRCKDGSELIIKHKFYYNPDFKIYAAISAIDETGMAVSRIVKTLRESSVDEKIISKISAELCTPKHIINVR